MYLCPLNNFERLLDHHHKNRVMEAIKTCLVGICIRSQRSASALREPIIEVAVRCPLTCLVRYSALIIINFFGCEMSKDDKILRKN